MPDLHALRTLADGTLSRRNFFLLAAGAAGGALLAGTARPAPAAAATPTLPGEYYRKGDQRTAAGTPYDNICVRIDGDAARIFVPHTATPYQSAPVAVAWFYHGAGGDHNALEGGLKGSAQAAVDRGAIAICQTAGGTTYSNERARALQVAGYTYLSGLFSISTNVLRSTSGGGALACETYASRLLPNVVGMYAVNATFDVRAHYDQGGNARASVVNAYGDDLDVISAGNPARLTAASWRNARVRIVVASPSESDTSVPPEQHGLALRALALPVAAEASLRTHANGHSTPGFVIADFVDAMDRWGVPDIRDTHVPDTLAPDVRIVSPQTGAVLSGVVTGRVAATDDAALTDVGFYAGTQRLATATRVAGTDEWSVRFDTARAPVGTFSVTARATDESGNVGVSAPVRITIRR